MNLPLDLSIQKKSFRLLACQDKRSINQNPLVVYKLFHKCLCIWQNVKKRINIENIVIKITRWGIIKKKYNGLV